MTPRGYGELVWHYLVLNKKPHTLWEGAEAGRAAEVSS